MTEHPQRIVVVDDEPQIRRFLKPVLAAQDYVVIEASNGADAIVRVATEHPDLVILDLGLPDIDGVEVIERIREWSQVPIIVLSVRSGEREKIAALDRGADDFVTKPFGVGELLARVRAALRVRGRAGQPQEPIIQSHGLTIDLGRRTVTRNGELLHLTPKEYDLLRVLASNAGRVVTHGHLLREVWGPGASGESHYLRVYVGTLRRKVELNAAQPSIIITEPGVGYRFQEDE